MHIYWALGISLAQDHFVAIPEIRPRPKEHPSTRVIDQTGPDQTNFKVPRSIVEVGFNFHHHRCRRWVMRVYIIYTNIELFHIL